MGILIVYPLAFHSSSPAREQCGAIEYQKIVDRYSSEDFIDFATTLRKRMQINFDITKRPASESRRGKRLNSGMCLNNLRYRALPGWKKVSQVLSTNTLHGRALCI